MNAYRIHQITIAGTEIVCESINEDPGIAIFDESGGASSATTISGAKQQKPVLKGTTKDLKKLLDTVPIAGLPITGSGSSKVIYYDGKLADGAIYASGSAHRKTTINRGLVVVDSISARGNDAATANFTVYAVYDGTNAPLVRATGQALPSTPATLTDVWVCGPASINSTTWETQGVSLNIGPDVVERYRDGEVFPRMVGINKYDVTAQIDTLDLASTAIDAAAADSVIYFRKHDSNTGTRVAEATAEHISLTIASGYQYAGASSRQWPTDSNGQINLKGVYDGTNAIIVVDTTAAIA